MPLSLYISFQFVSFLNSGPVTGFPCLGAVCAAGQVSSWSIGPRENFILVFIDWTDVDAQSHVAVGVGLCADSRQLWSLFWLLSMCPFVGLGWEGEECEGWVVIQHYQLSVESSRDVMKSL